MTYSAKLHEHRHSWLGSGRRILLRPLDPFLAAKSTKLGTLKVAKKSKTRKREVIEVMYGEVSK